MHQWQLCLGLFVTSRQSQAKEAPSILVRLVSNKAPLWKPRELDAYYGDCYIVAVVK